MLTRNLLVIGGLVILVAVAVGTGTGIILPDDKDTIFTAILSLLAGLGIGGGAINIKR